MAKILIVDDSMSMRRLVHGTLSEAGHEVVEADDGTSALAIANDGSSRFDVVVTDVNMPNMDGITLLTELRKLAHFRFTPILVLTTEMNPAKKTEARRNGATGWLVKPFNPTQLLATVRKVLD